jgi:hypothetical protein
MTTTALPDFALAIAYQHIDDLRSTARRHDVPARLVFARTSRAGKTALHWLWQGQLALVPRHLVDPAPQRSPY